MRLDAIQFSCARGRVSLDIETTGFNPYKDNLLGVGVYSQDSNIAGFWPTNNPKEVAYIIRTCWPKGTTIIAHNLKFELKWLGLSRKDVNQFKLYDTQIAEHLLNESVSLDLGSTERRRLKTDSKAKLQALAEPYGGMKRTGEWPLALLADYCLNDCIITYNIASAQVKRLRHEKLTNPFNIMMALLPVMSDAEQRGMFVDDEAYWSTYNRLLQMEEQVEGRWEELLTDYGVIEKVNRKSAKQLSNLLYNTLKIPWPEPLPGEEMTSTATGKEVLPRLDHPVANFALSAKKLQTAKGYMESYQELWRPENDGFVLHPDFNLTGTVTGRLSCSKPNLQQVHSKAVATDIDPTGQGIALRGVFKARPGHKLVSIDYKQMEAAFFGVRSQDPFMLEAIRSGQDIHSEVAKILFGEYDENLRKIVKNMNFGILYGLGKDKLARSLGVDVEEATDLLDTYFTKFRRVRPYMHEVATQLRNTGFVRYWSGRKRRILDPEKRYKGVNAEVQGGCADILAVAAVRCADYLTPIDGHILALIHDEILFEVPEEAAEKAACDLSQLMAVEDALGFPFNTDAVVCDYWSEAG